MKQSVSLILGAGALLGALSFTPSLAEILVESSEDGDEVHIMIDREHSNGHISREYYDGEEISIDEENTNGHILRMMIDDGEQVSTCVRLEAEDGTPGPLTCVINNDRESGDYYFAGDSHTSREVEREVRQAMREHEREMAQFEREMAEFEREMESYDWGLSGLAEAVAHIADAAMNIESTVMTALAESGVRIESDSNGNETVWIDSDKDDDPSIRVVSQSDGRDLVYMYFDGFENDYHYVIESDERGGNHTTVHAYDVSTVEIRETHDHDGQFNTDASREDGPHLTINTDHPDDVRVIRLDRSRFDG